MKRRNRFCIFALGLLTCVFLFIHIISSDDLHTSADGSDFLVWKKHADQAHLQIRRVPTSFQLLSLETYFDVSVSPSDWNRVSEGYIARLVIDERTMDSKVIYVYDGPWDPLTLLRF
ncbi:hypothetical protein EHV15_34840 [Paenibacillus oralis]|uniref:Uncharacterized protein n=1 Tax=Paenibacillus oralis TaxID=2490856 RepID=A0A3P3T9V0_9BACL|nr:hypothetical protein [Paenibacillus oralis]RRJ54770.1 hypothetical protein EHV15_34840 [Paenibacillus oralis]